MTTSNANVVAAATSRPAHCVVKGCRRKPYFTQSDRSGTGGEHDHSTAATHCRGHQPDACVPQQGASSSSLSNKNNPREAMLMAIALTPCEPGEREGISSARTAPATTTSAVSPSLALPPNKTSRPFACRFEGCNKRASHGVERNKRPTHCPAHRDQTTMVADHRHRLCDAEMDPPCVRQASYGWPSAPAAAVVATEREPESTRVAKITNGSESGANAKRGTTTTPTKKGSAQRQALFCAAHRKVGMVDLRNSRGCAAEGCSKRPTHAFDGQKAKFCAAHREVGMMNVVRTLCEVDGCMIARRFGSPGQKPRFCGAHREGGMVNLKDRRCEYPLCPSQPSFAAVGENKPRFCSHHKKQSMINVRHPRCRYRDPWGATCEVYPTYANKDAKAPVFCLDHRMSGMVDLKRAKEASKRSRKRRRPQPPLVPGSTFGSDPIAANISEMLNFGAIGALAGTGAIVSVGGETLPAPPSPPSTREMGDAVGASIDVACMDVRSSHSNQLLPEMLGSSVMTAGAEKVNGVGMSGNLKLATAETEPRSAVSTGRDVRVSSDAGETRDSKNRRARVPFSESAFALLPVSIPRGSAAIQREVEAAVAAAAAAAAAAAVESGAANGNATAALDDNNVQQEQNIGEGGLLLPGQQTPREPVSFSAEDPASSVLISGLETLNRNELFDDGFNNNRDLDTAERPDADGSPPFLSISGSEQHLGHYRQATPVCSVISSRDHVSEFSRVAQQVDGGVTQRENGHANDEKEDREGGDVEEQRKSRVGCREKSNARVDTEGGGALRWDCIKCSKAIEERDRYVLVPCGHGLFHNSCTADFAAIGTGGGRPCPTCRKMVLSTMQIFV